MATKYTLLSWFLVIIVQYDIVLASKSCNCSCNSGGIDFDDLDPVTQEKVNNISKELKVDTRNTSSHTRTLVSVSDPRPSAQAAGYIGILILTIVFGSLVLLDLTRVCVKPETKYMD
ncbi:uncharacterized protein LOC130052616 [Ostrea edulis]|uniref:uncharacterized protein LOC130052616 n=1 Tax=Ostrea edulis TaxID=37623 RepID=UPI0024AFB4F3|nr:uncharacterized protein LOC130052616 [Ostrea edulis]